MRCFLPREKLAALQAQLAPTSTEERRLITILFTDIVGSTALAERLDPEEWRKIVAKLHETVGNAISQHHGTVAQYLGDGLLAFFGAQGSHEQDPENAIRAALEAQTAVAKLDRANPIRIRIGIHTGLVIVGELGAELHKEFSATGDAMNLAARLQSAAPPGGILISDDTYRYVRGVFDVTPQPPRTVKGKREPLQTFLVRRAKARAFRSMMRGVAGIQTRTIGRDAELRQLRVAYLDAYENRRVVWAQLMGEPGVGKSRLLQDTNDWIELRDETVRVFRGRAFAGEQNQAFALIRRLWFDRFQIAEDAPLVQAEAKWVERFGELTGINDPEPAQALGLLAGLPFEDSPHIGALRNDPQQVKGRAFVVSRQALAAIRAEYPIQMLLEDLHWADAASLEYLQEVVLAEDRTQTPDHAELGGMFVLATARTEWKPAEALTTGGRRAAAADGEPSSTVDRYPSFVQINLAPLSDTATRELAHDLLRNVAEVPAEAIGLIVERAEGVPYFAEELVSYFLDRGIIDRTTEPWTFVAGKLQEAPLPATLQYLLRARLDTLAQAERVALQRGAIFGRNFWAGGVDALGGQQSAQALEPLQPRGFVQLQSESVLEGESEWSFHHALLRDVTYESVLKRERAALHRKAAAWLEQQARQAGRVDEFAGLLGEHAERAGELQQAADWYLLAGESASRQAATREALTYFDRALTLIPQNDHERRWRARLGREAMHSLRGEREPQREDIAALLTLAREMNDDTRLAQAQLRLALLHQALGDYRTVQVATAAARAAAQRARLGGGNEQENLIVEVRALRYEAEARARLGEPYRHIAEQALALAEQSGNDAAVAHALLWVARGYGAAGDLARAAQLLTRQAEIARRIGDRSLEGIALASIGAFAYAKLGLYKLELTAMEQSRRLYESLGMRRRVAIATGDLGYAHMLIGDLWNARLLTEQALKEATAIGDADSQAVFLSNLAELSERTGDYTGAVRQYAEAREIFVAMGSIVATLEPWAGLARCALAQGRLDEARQLATEVWNYLCTQEIEGSWSLAVQYKTVADVFDALGDTETSRVAIEAGYRELIARAEKISDREWRKSFLENVAENRAIVEMWERMDRGARLVRLQITLMGAEISYTDAPRRPSLS